MRIAAPLTAVLCLCSLACGNDSASVRLALPLAQRQALTGFDEGGTALITLDVACDDGTRERRENELSTRVDSIAFFVPACGQATLSLAISTTYDRAAPFVALESSATAFLSRGENVDVTFEGIAYGELILDPVGEPLTVCTYQDAAQTSPAQEVDMSSGSVVTLRVPAGDYEIYCYDSLSSLPNYQPTRVGAGQRVGPDLTLIPNVPPDRDAPEIRDLVFSSIVSTGAIASWGFTTSSLSTLVFTWEIALDPQFAQLLQAPTTTAQPFANLTGLSAGTQYYVRVNGQDEYGASNTLTGDFTTTTPGGSRFLSDLQVNGATVDAFSPTFFSYNASVDPLDTTVEIRAVTQSASSFVRIATGVENMGGTVDELPVVEGNNDFTIYVRNSDNSATQTYVLSVFKPPT